MFLNENRVNQKLTTEKVTNLIGRWTKKYSKTKINKESYTSNVPVVPEVPGKFQTRSQYLNITFENIGTMLAFKSLQEFNTKMKKRKKMKMEARSNGAIPSIRFFI